MEEYADNWTELLERVILKLENECLDWQKEFERHGFSYVWDNAYAYVCRQEVIDGLDDIKNTYIEEAKNRRNRGHILPAAPIAEETLQKALLVPDLLYKLTDIGIIQNSAFDAEIWDILKDEIKEKLEKETAK